MGDRQGFSERTAQHWVAWLFGESQGCKLVANVSSQEKRGHEAQDGSSKVSLRLGIGSPGSEGALLISSKGGFLGAGEGLGLRLVIGKTSSSPGNTVTWAQSLENPGRGGHILLAYQKKPHAERHGGQPSGAWTVGRSSVSYTQGQEKDCGLGTCPSLGCATVRSWLKGEGFHLVICQ